MQLVGRQLRQPTPINRAAEFCTLSERMNDSSGGMQFAILESTFEQTRSL
jgi:hypothetical protein